MGGVHKVNTLLFFRLNHKVFGIITQLKTNVDACNQFWFLLLQNFSVAISVSPRVCFILVLILISMFLK